MNRSTLRIARFAAVLLALLGTGCSATEKEGFDDTSSGDPEVTGGTGVGGHFVFEPGGGGGGTGEPGELTGILRDFRSDHPDFEYKVADDRGIVLPDLGADGKPVYAGAEGHPTTNGKGPFDQWFRDVPGVNRRSLLTIALAPNASGVWTYSNGAFFPIDGRGFGNEGNPHNYHFTFELHTRFTYRGGEVFRFTGDDDLFTYVNGHLAIDLGGVHGAESEAIDLDLRAGELGIVPGNEYALDFFFAERHTSESTFQIDTTIEGLVSTGEPR